MDTITNSYVVIRRCYISAVNEIKRGLMPENIAPTLWKALDIGANVLKIDVHISYYKQVVVAHDSYKPQL